MSKIYEPGKKAKEYCEFAVNLYKGCNHGCTYCYGPPAAHISRDNFATVVPTKDTINNITKDAHLYAGRHVLMCFLTDPYNSLDEDMQLTRQAIEILIANSAQPVILTKAGKKSTRDFDLLDSSCCYGATLTFTSEADSLEWEPNASLPEERMDALKEAKRLGIRTWASLEPVIDPRQTLELVRLTHEYVDHYKVGRWNYDKRANATDWSAFLFDIRKTMKTYGKSEISKPSFGDGFYIKSELKLTNKS